MDRMKLALKVFLWGVILVSSVRADEGVYLPNYAASPAAVIVEESPTPTPATKPQPEISCSLRVTLPINKVAPMEVVFEAGGEMEGKAITQFRYIFGDGESATGSGVMKHKYVAAGRYQARVTPIVEGVGELPICKTTITVEAPKSTPNPTPEPTITAAAGTIASVATEAASASGDMSEQPKTGLSGWWWGWWISLLMGWLGVVVWRQKQHLQIG